MEIQRWLNVDPIFSVTFSEDRQRWRTLTGRLLKVKFEPWKVVEKSPRGRFNECSDERSGDLKKRCTDVQPTFKLNLSGIGGGFPADWPSKINQIRTPSLAFLDIKMYIPTKIRKIYRKHVFTSVKDLIWVWLPILYKKTSFYDNTNNRIISAIFESRKMSTLLTMKIALKWCILFLLNARPSPRFVAHYWSSDTSL